MNQPKSLEEVMQRIRAQVGGPGNADGAAQAPFVTTAARADRWHGSAGARVGSEGTEAGEAPAHFHLKLHELSQLNKEISTAVEGTRLVGQLNPRNPGLMSNAIQFVKKGMRRSLTWYTRPLHLHQGGVVRALEQIYAILDNHNDSFRKVTAEFHRQAMAIEEVSAEFAARTAALEETINLSVNQKLRAFDERLAALQSDIGPLQNRMEHLGTGIESLKRESEALGGKVSRVASAVESQQTQLTAHRVVLDEQRAALEGRLNPLADHLTSLSGEVGWLREELQRTRDQLREVGTRARVHERDVRRTLFALQNGPAPSGEAKYPTPAMFVSEVKGDKEFDYFAFEARYRGEESDIRNRQREYLEYFRGREDVVDIGCGRGEFLELLRENQIKARGVELGLDQYLLCKEKGLDVVQADLFTFLESLPDDTLGGLFSAQVIEHMTASDQLSYVALAYRKTKPGSPVIFETINAQCVYAVMRNFFLDPTHVRPMHPETLQFAMQSVHFKNVELRFSGPVSDKQIPQLRLDGDSEQLAAFNRSMQELNDLVFGYQDYAAIGWK